MTEYDVALRTATGDDEDLMDDIVVNNVGCFRAEAMSEKNWWVACYVGGEEVVFNVTAKGRPLRLEWRFSYATGNLRFEQ